MENIDLAKVHERVVNEIADHHRMTQEEAEDFYSSIKCWCLNNVTNKSWSNKVKKAKAITTYGLKHVCERDLEKYVANNWIKAALCEKDFALQEYRYERAITMDDIFTNSVNFRFRIKKM